jgi:hypothetical protein
MPFQGEEVFGLSAPQGNAWAGECHPFGVKKGPPLHQAEPSSKRYSELQTALTPVRFENRSLLANCLGVVGLDSGFQREPGLDGGAEARREKRQRSRKMLASLAAPSKML